ncbi:hypothetical protein K488DRAFT_81335 [Vararia minispora EC-137]|uniref:Uncharacterized protein n=1 Tax=Vararia minispora EC-137 TaxID=1314806 RepID=A0ACB8Q434_9AGAM|nr:hypothetical protein K488DRAFT_81335 [Vararia minispora EC-137]
MTPDEHERFCAALCRFLIMSNAAWWTVEIPFVRNFFFEWMGISVLPSRQSLSGRILDREVEKAEKTIMAEVGGRFGTGQCDGWKNIKKEAVVGSSMNVEHKPHLINTHEITKECKTAENLLAIVLRDIKYCVESLRVIVVAWCTDASGESSKMRSVTV